jgi:hypothetical protein
MNTQEEESVPISNDAIENLHFEDEDELLESDEDEMQTESDSVNEDSYTGSSQEYSQQNVFYFQNMDQLLSNYFSSDDVNVVNAIQNLEKSITNFTNVIKDSLEQNAKCTLRVAKILESASTNFNKSKSQ